MTYYMNGRYGLRELQNLYNTFVILFLLTFYHRHYVIFTPSYFGWFIKGNFLCTFPFANHHPTKIKWKRPKPCEGAHNPNILAGLPWLECCLTTPGWMNYRHSQTQPQQWLITHLFPDFSENQIKSGFMAAHFLMFGIKIILILQLSMHYFITWPVYFQILTLVFTNTF